MQAFNETSQRFLAWLLAEQDERHIGAEWSVDRSPTFQKVAVIRRAADVWTVNHWVNINGDLCLDPGMDVWRGSDGRYYPASITQTLGAQLPTQECIVFDAAGRVRAFRPSLQRQAASFGNLWFRNVVQQQGLAAELRAAVRS